MDNVRNQKIHRYYARFCAGRLLDFVNSFATQKGVALFKSAATPFFSSSGTVGPRKLKFKT